MAKFSRSGEPDAEGRDVIDPDRSGGLVLGQLTGNRGPAPGILLDRRQVRERRRGFWRPFLYGNFRPRRRLSRRELDQHRFLFDWHEPRILYLALAVLLLSCTDALFTLNLLTAGAHEANAVMDAMLSDSTERFLMVKIGVTAISVIILVAAARRRFFGLFRVERLLQAICAGYLLLICYELYLFSYVFELHFERGHLMPWPSPW